MGYQSKIKSPKGAIHEYKKPPREKRKDRKHLRIHIGRPIMAEKQTVSEREVTGVTLKQLHTLGIQKFGSSPFSDHFDRWMTNVDLVLCEFKSHPNISLDEKFVTECSQILSNIKHQLEDISRKEASLDQELNKLSSWRNRLKRINKEYSALTGSIKGQRNREIKRLNSIIDCLKKDQDEIIRMKTGFFHGVSRKKREQKEMAIIQELKDKQTELELAILDFSAKQKEIRVEYDKKREPVLEEVKKFRRIIQVMETDVSLEERWFACEALIDAVNTFMQRKVNPILKGDQTKNPL
jgi:vacuolar-type H+-ATPase subunit I/STV1